MIYIQDNDLLDYILYKKIKLIKSLNYFIKIVIKNLFIR